MQSPFAPNKNTPKITVINPHINVDAELHIPYDDIKKFYKTSEMVPNNTCWKGTIKHHDKGWTLSNITLYAQKPSEGKNLGPQNEDSEHIVYIVKSDKITFEELPKAADNPCIVLHVKDNALNTYYVDMPNNQMLEGVKTVITGNDPFAHLEAEIKAEIKEKVRKISYGSSFYSGTGPNTRYPHNKPHYNGGSVHNGSSVISSTRQKTYNDIDYNPEDFGF